MSALPLKADKAQTSVLSASCQSRPNALHCYWITLVRAWRQALARSPAISLLTGVTRRRCAQRLAWGGVTAWLYVWELASVSLLFFCFFIILLIFNFFFVF